MLSVMIEKIAFLNENLYIFLISASNIDHLEKHLTVYVSSKKMVKICIENKE